MNLSRAARQDKPSAPHWIKDVSWSEGKVSVDLPREAVKDLPSFESFAQLDHHPTKASTRTAAVIEATRQASDDRLDLSMPLRRCFRRRGRSTEA
jgi:hypothetical protein